MAERSDNIYGTFSDRSGTHVSADVSSPLSPVHNVLHHSCSTDDTPQESQPIKKSHGLSSEEAAKLLLQYGTLTTV